MTARAGREAFEAKCLKVVLVGAPRAGTKDVFAQLVRLRPRLDERTDSAARVASAAIERDGRRFLLVAVPDLYSLGGYTAEELLAEQEIIEDRPNVIVVVANIAHLERHLVLLTQVMSLRTAKVLCLTRTEESPHIGVAVDTKQMSALLGIEVVEVTLGETDGIARLEAAIAEAASISVQPTKPVLGPALEQALEVLSGQLAAAGIAAQCSRFIAVRLLAGHSATLQLVETLGEGGRSALAQADQLQREIEDDSGRDVLTALAEQRHGFVAGLLGEVRLQKVSEDSRSFSDKLDSVLCHRVLGLPFFFAVMYALFWMTFAGGDLMMHGIESGLGTVKGNLFSLWPANSAPLLRSLVQDGLFGGVGAVLIFLPYIALLFFGLALLEDSGYMARAVFLLDRAMHCFSLHGKCFIPLVTGLGCTVPALMATRLLESRRDRLITALVLPLVSCGSRLTIWALLVPAFFPPFWRAPVLFAIYLFGVAIALLLARLLGKTLLREDEAPFVMELPPYRASTFSAALRQMAARSAMFLRNAGTVIFAVALVMWALSSFPRLEPSAADTGIAHNKTIDGPASARRAAERLEHSAAGRIGKAIQPIFAPLGFDWKISSAIVGAFLAKEVFVVNLGVIYSAGDPRGDPTALSALLARDYDRSTGLALILFLLIATPCAATMAAVRREIGSKWAAAQFCTLTALGYALAFIARWFGVAFA